MRGKIASQFDDGCYFLNHPVINWTRTNGDPRAPPDLISSRLPTVKKFDGKLSGSYAWPFFFQFPSEVIVVQDGEQQKYPTPQTFVERGTDVTIQYSLVLKMTHGMLRTDSKFVFLSSCLSFTVSLFIYPYALDFTLALYMSPTSFPLLSLSCVRWHISMRPRSLVLKLILWDGIPCLQLLYLANSLIDLSS